MSKNLNEDFDWYKNPILQGEENDYGAYDYLINKLPPNTRTWLHKTDKCEYCGKYHKINLHTISWFYTTCDEDCFEDVQCLPCFLKEKIFSIKNKILRKIQRTHEFTKLLLYFHKNSERKENWITCYKKLKKIY